MKNTYIIALKAGNYPVLFKVKPYNCIVNMFDTFTHAYIMESKEKAEKIWDDRYKMRENRKNDEKYPEFY